MGFVLSGLLALVAPQDGPTQVVWKWEADDTHCVLRQDLGEARFLEVSTSPGNDQGGIGIVDRAPKVRAWKPLSAVELTFAPGGIITNDGFIVPTKNPSGRRVMVRLSGNDLDRFSGAAAVTLSHAEFGTLRAPVRSFAAAITALRACEDRKMSQWGIDTGAWRALPVKPIPKTPPAKWLSWLDYPDREKIYANDITVVARLDVGADGSVQGCTVVNRPPAEFIPAACSALRSNAKFEPARDLSGKNVPAPHIVQVVFGAYHL